MSLDTPVAFFIFNRPELTQIVFEAIAKAKPKKLLVVADGSRSPEEEEKCQKSRAIINRVDWDCQVLTNFAEKNLGCRQRLASGISWVFSEVEAAIILEDDCLPSPCFFTFCETLLERYRDDERVMMISGDNFQLGQKRTDYSYYFSKYAHIWGWAAWRRSWHYYDVDMKSWEEYKKLGFIRSLCEDYYEQKYWTDIFDRVCEGAIDTWDYQWMYACWCQNGLSIIPNSNLVSNIGYGIDSTHTRGESPWAKLPTQDIDEINHPRFVARHTEADAYTFDYKFGGKSMREGDTLTYRLRLRLSEVKTKIKCLIGKIKS